MITSTSFADKNKAFEKLSAAKKRVAIAVDVLAQLASGFLIPTSGLYCRVDNRLNSQQLNQDLSTTLTEVSECRVCGLGGLFVGAVLNADKLRTGRANCGRFELNLDSSTVKTYLAQFFSNAQIRKIETAFERSRQFKGGPIAENFAADVDDVSDRMRLIMQNIIMHKGTFHPEVKPVHKWVMEGYRGV